MRNIFGWVKTNEVILAKQGYKCFIWVTSLRTIHGKICFIVSFLDGPSKLRHFSMLTASNTTQARQPKPTKRLMQTSWFQTNFAVYLCHWHCIYNSLLLQEISVPGRLTTAMTAQELWVLLGSELWGYLRKLLLQWSKSLTDVASNFDFISKRWDATRAALRFLSSIIVANITSYLSWHTVKWPLIVATFPCLDTLHRFVTVAKNRVHLNRMVSHVSPTSI